MSTDKPLVLFKKYLVATNKIKELKTVDLLEKESKKYGGLTFIGYQGVKNLFTQLIDKNRLQDFFDLKVILFSYYKWFHEVYIPDKYPKERLISNPVKSFNYVYADPRKHKIVPVETINEVFLKAKDNLLFCTIIEILFYTAIKGKDLVKLKWINHRDNNNYHLISIIRIATRRYGFILHLESIFSVYMVTNVNNDNEFIFNNPASNKKFTLRELKEYLDHVFSEYGLKPLSIEDIRLSGLQHMNETDKERFAHHMLWYDWLETERVTMLENYKNGNDPIAKALYG